MTFIPDDELEERPPRRRPKVQRRREGSDKPAASAGAPAADATPARNDPKVEVAVQKSNPDAMPAIEAEGKWTMAIDGQRGKAYDYLFRPHELSALLHADGKLVYYALLGDEIVRVTHE